MALVKCPECGKEISDSSKKCIHCGYKFPRKKMEAQRKKKLIILSSIIALMLIAAIVIVLVFTVIIPKRNQRIEREKEKKRLKARYEQAEEALSMGLFDSAAAYFQELGDYQDSAERVKECYNRKSDMYYQKGMNYYNEMLKIYRGEYTGEALREAWRINGRDGDDLGEGAVKAFENAGDYKDAKSMIPKARLLAGYVDCIKVSSLYSENSEQITKQIKLSGDKLSITADDIDWGAWMAATTYPAYSKFRSLLTIYLDFPSSVENEIGNSSQIMGKQSAKNKAGDLEVVWSVTNNLRVNAIIRVAQ